MPTIRPSDKHPAEEVLFGLGGGEPFTLSPGGEYKTDDLEVADNAKAHPWLAVEDDPAPPQPDPDPEIEPNLVAIDAGLDQTKPQEAAGGFATTIAAVDSSPSYAKAAADKPVVYATLNEPEEEKD